MLAVAAAAFAAACATACAGLLGVNDIYLDEHAPDVGGMEAGSGAEGGLPPDSAVSACGDTKGNPKNCGSCGHDCLGGKCSEGSCQPVAVVTPGLARPHALGIDDQSLYFSSSEDPDPYTIQKIAKDSTLGVPRKLAQATDGNVYTMAVDGSHVYWGAGASDRPGAIERVLLDGGSKETVALAKDPGGLSLGTSNVYWSNIYVLDGAGAHVASEVVTAPKGTGGVATILAPNEPAATATRVAGSHLYWTQKDPGAGSSGVLRRCTLPACADSNDVATGLNNPDALAENGANLYYATEATVVELPIGSAGPGRTIAEGQPRAYAGVVADKRDVYWINLGTNEAGFTNGDVRRCPISNGKADCGSTGIVLAKAMYPRAIVLDARAVYWTSEGDRTIYRLAR